MPKSRSQKSSYDPNDVPNFLNDLDRDTIDNAKSRIDENFENWVQAVEGDQPGMRELYTQFGVEDSDRIHEARTSIKKRNTETDKKNATGARQDLRDNRRGK